MLNAVHHKHALHAVTQAVPVDNVPPWVSTLLPLVQSPICDTFLCSFAVLLPLMIWNRINLHRRGASRKNKPLHFVAYLLFLGASYYVLNKYPVLSLVLQWPYYREHRLEIWAGFLAAGLLARMISALFAKLFLRGNGGHLSHATGGASPYVMLPNPPPDHGWYGLPKTRVTRQRTYHIEER